jgi:hypothetical protein
MFPDDTSILISSSNCTDLNQVHTSVLSHIAKWFQANQFALNVEKTNMVKFTPTKFLHYPLQLTYEHKIITEADNMKFLGLQLDNHLTWQTHIDQLHGRPTWTSHMADPHGPVTWQTHMDQSRGRPTWTSHVADPHGPVTWQTHMDQSRGRPTWTSYMADPHRPVTWQTHIDQLHGRPT